MITITKPHYLLFCEGNAGPAFGFPQDDASRWRFVLENVESGHKVEAWDYEEILHPDRISLMAVIRGLEALDQPSKVTLVTTNRYVARGLQYGLTEWRENDFCWEHFGSIQPIRNQDLWRRVDVALRFHEVTCRWMAYDSQQDRVEGDRRDVPVETLASKASDVPTKEEQFSEPPRVRSRSFSAMTRAATELLGSREAKELLGSREATGSSIPSGAIHSHCGVSSAQVRSVLDKADKRPEIAQAIEQSLNISATCQSTWFEWCTAPARWIWRFVLRADTMLVYAVRSMLMLDPKPETYRARR